MVLRCGAVVGEEMVGTEAEGGGVDEPLALEVDQERVGAQGNPLPRIGWETSARMNSHRKCLRSDL